MCRHAFDLGSSMMLVVTPFHPMTADVVSD
jgi:hypothetical protein